MILQLRNRQLKCTFWRSKAFPNSIFKKNCWNELELQNRQLKCTFRHFKAHIFHCRQCCAVWQYLRTMIHISTLQAAPNGIRAFTKLHFHYFHTFERIFSRTILYIFMNMNIFCYYPKYILQTY